MSDRTQTTPTGVDAIVADAVRHLEWLRENGVSELPPEPAAESRAAAHRAAEPPPSPPAPAVAGATHQRAPAGSAPRPDVPSAPAPPPPAKGPDPAAKGCGSRELLAVRAELGECTRCKLAGGRTHLVFGVGNPHAAIMFVGEGPGADEDAQGEPFVGRAGQLLTKMIEAMGFRREEVYIANVVKCRPPGNRDPEPDEIAACEPFLRAQIAAVKPRVIVALGRFAVQTLLRDPTPITRQRGRWREYEGVKLMPTFHPAYLLRNPPEKKKAWDDLQKVMSEFGKVPPAR